MGSSIRSARLVPRVRLAALAALALVAAPRASAVAQDSVATPAPVAAMVQGRVGIPAGKDVLPVPGVFVTVHRVGPDAAGALDSMRTGADGRYRLDYTRFGSGEAVYFAAVVYRGIAYFSPPLTGPRTTEDEGTIVVFDTTSAPIPFSIAGHHVVVGAPASSGGRRVVEVFELSNDTTVTAVGRDSLTAVWTTDLPRGATEFAAGEGDVAATALVERDGKVVMLAPFGPGIKQLSFSYTLPPRAFPLEFTTARPVGVLEVLLEEQGAQARAASLRSQGNAETQGRTFKRFLGQSVPGGERVRVDVPVVAASTRQRVLVGVGVAIGLAMAAALVLALRRRGRPVVGEPAAPTADSLAAAIAALDARHESGDATLSDESYASQRAALKESLSASLATSRR